MNLSYAKILDSMAEIAALADAERTPEQQTLYDTKLAELCQQEEDKIDSFGGFVRYTKAQEEFLDAEIKRLQAKKKAYTKARENSLQHYAFVMLNNGIEEAQGKHTKLSFRDSVSVKVPDDASVLPEVFQRVTTKIEADKNVIKEALVAGLSVEGCELVYSKNLQVK